MTKSPYAKAIQDSLGFWIPSCGLRTPGTGLRIPCQWNLDSGFQSQGFYISQEKNFVNPYFVKNWWILGASAHPLQELIQASCMLRLHPTHSLWQLAVILLCWTIATKWNGETFKLLIFPSLFWLCYLLQQILHYMGHRYKQGKGVQRYKSSDEDMPKLFAGLTFAVFQNVVREQRAYIWISLYSRGFEFFGDWINSTVLTHRKTCDSVGVP